MWQDPSLLLETPGGHTRWLFLFLHSLSLWFDLSFSIFTSLPGLSKEVRVQTSKLYILAHNTLSAILKPKSSKKKFLHNFGAKTSFMKIPDPNWRDALSSLFLYWSVNIIITCCRSTSVFDYRMAQTSMGALVDYLSKTWIELNSEIHPPPRGLHMVLYHLLTKKSHRKAPATPPPCSLSPCPLDSQGSENEACNLHSACPKQNSWLLFSHRFTHISYTPIMHPSCLDQNTKHQPGFLSVPHNSTFKTSGGRVSSKMSWMCPWPITFTHYPQGKPPYWLHLTRADSPQGRQSY